MAYAVSYREGQEALLYYAAADGTASPSFTAFGIVSDNKFSIKANKVSGNFRDSGWTNNRPGQRNIEGEFTARRKTSDTTYQAFKAAILAGTVVSIKILPYSGASDEVVNADYMIEEFAFSEEMDSFQTVSVKYALNIDSRAPSVT